jgi:hypothetical protein
LTPPERNRTKAILSARLPDEDLSVFDGTFAMPLNIEQVGTEQTEGAMMELLVREERIETLCCIQPD